jgi:hypothetical protein
MAEYRKTDAIGRMFISGRMGDGMFLSYRQRNPGVFARRHRPSLTLWGEQGDRVENVSVRGRLTWHQRFSGS